MRELQKVMSRVRRYGGRTAVRIDADRAARCMFVASAQLRRHGEAGPFVCKYFNGKKEGRCRRGVVRATVMADG
jgi:hypothetical protein